MNMMYALPDYPILGSIREFIKERNLTNVVNMINALLIKAVREVIRKFIQETNLKNVVSVTNVYPRTPSESHQRIHT